MWQPRMNSKAGLIVCAIILTLSVFDCGAETTTVSSGECLGVDCIKPNDTSAFSPPPADGMSRLMPTTQSIVSNDTKDPSASTIDIVTTPDTGSLGLSSYSSFSQSGQTGFNPSPFLGVISETHINSYPQGLAVGEVFPDTVGDRHQGGHKYLYSIAGQRTPHTGHSYHDQVTRHRPTASTATDSTDSFLSTQETPVKITIRPPSPESLRPTVETGYASITYAPHRETPLTSSSKSLGYPIFEIPDRFKDFKEVSNSITDYKPPAPIAFPGYDKPIREDGYDDRPDAFATSGPASGPDAFGGPVPLPGAGGLGGYGPGLPPPPAFTSPPALFNQKGPGFYKGGKWKGFYKVLASLIPLGLLIAAFTPNLLVVNATENPTTTTKTSYRSLESVLNAPEIPAGLEMTQCQKKKVCETLLEVDDTYKSFVDSLVFRAGKSFKEAVDLAKENKCAEITCIT